MTAADWDDLSDTICNTLNFGGGVITAGREWCEDNGQRYTEAVEAFIYTTQKEWSETCDE